ncbi:hypothetical protein HYT33_04615 [Candidatus Roizmanbacteria bacterium]|nr:hypothetical protein [Candidatus Roizmanbacteria bacterium]
MEVSKPNTSYNITAVLKTAQGTVTDYSDFVYKWTIDNPAIATITPFGLCYDQIGSCPNNYLRIFATSEGKTMIRVSVMRLSTKEVVASLAFNVRVFGPPVTPLPPPKETPVPTKALTPTPTGKFCPQVVTFARNRKNGACSNFGSPCDVPPGWVQVKSCLLPTPTKTPPAGKLPTPWPIRNWLIRLFSLFR